MPKRIQRKRTKGWKMPAGAVYIGRPTKWGNPYPVGSEYEGIDGSLNEVQDVDHSLELYRHWLKIWAEFKGIDQLRGKDLACFCPLDQPCHADVLLEMANQ